MSSELLPAPTSSHTKISDMTLDEKRKLFGRPTARDLWSWYSNDESFADVAVGSLIVGGSIGVAAGALSIGINLLVFAIWGLSSTAATVILAGIFFVIGWVIFFRSHMEPMHEHQAKRYDREHSEEIYGIRVNQLEDKCHVQLVCRRGVDRWEIESRTFNGEEVGAAAEYIDALQLRIDTHEQAQQALIAQQQEQALEQKHSQQAQLVEVQSTVQALQDLIPTSRRV